MLINILSIMRKITFYLVILISSFTYGQEYIDMTPQLANISKHLTIDGNTLQFKNNTKEQIIIRGKDLILHDRSSFIFSNVIVLLSGKIITKGTVKPLLINSHIFCKDSGNLKSPSIIETDNIDNVNIGNVSYIKSLKGNPVLWVYTTSGKRIFKGTKKEAQNFEVPVSKYDVKVVGVEFKDNVLFADK